MSKTIERPVLLEIRVSFVGIPLDVHGWSVVAGITSPSELRACGLASKLQ